MAVAVRPVCKLKTQQKAYRVAQGVGHGHSESVANTELNKEELMEYNIFKNPVVVLVGLGVPSQVRSVTEAYALLRDWPLSKKEVAHTMALNACRAALSGEVEAETARSMFLAFARKHDALAPDFEVAVRRSWAENSNIRRQP